jgi:hypothetical protein
MIRLRHICAALALVAATLPVLEGRAQPAGQDSAIGYALENLVSGTSATVHVGDTAYAVTPLRTWKSVSGHWCRRYEMTVTEPGNTPSRSEATRCRQDGVWMEPAE